MILEMTGIRPLQTEGLMQPADELSTHTDPCTPTSSTGVSSEGTGYFTSNNLTELPTPFYPPSLLEEDIKVKSEPSVARQIPSCLGFPELPQDKVSSEINPSDVATPDAWVPRDGRMVRLTGKHPFNAEAKLKDLYTQGFITPSSLFFVRNHGAVPIVDQHLANNWKLKVHGLCSKPVTFTLDDLRRKFRVVTIPVTLVCAGNRRKEQNMVQKSLGFSWGAAGLSTALFTGVYLADVLEYVLPLRGARHVVFEGCDDLPNGPYGTSQLLSWARDKRKGMMLAWAMNGLPLEPDHGFPLRLVVPGQIGGRSVKWLSRIELSEHESQHHLHFRDNKVLPMPVGPDQARAESHWWYDPRYIIRDLNVNSAIASPDHDEILDLSAQGADGTYPVKGYAYAGGGRRVTRVEVSTDDGDSWSLADITYPEDRFRATAYSDSVYGDLDMTESDTCFCWCFWTLEIPIQTIRTTRAIVVRCMDESLALQPRNMYWNATGMMNNWWFRVCVHKLSDEKVRFEHPTMAGTQPGGWMQRLKDEGLDPSKPDFKVDPTSTSVVKIDISVAELQSAQAKEEAWFVVKGEVYQGSGFFDDHPGGAQSIEIMAGEDATEDFMAIHSSDAKRQLIDFHIGTLDGDIGVKASDEPERNSTTKTFLNPKQWKKVELVNVQSVSKDTKIYRLALEKDDQELGLPFGQHVYIRLRRKVAGKDGLQSAGGELVQRAYTPLSRRNNKGFIDMLIKIYYPTATFPSGGRMTLGFSELVIGDTVEMKGPIGHFIWEGNGVASVHGEKKRIREIGLVCGGSGITPILQVLRAILTDPLDEETKVWVVDVNRHFEDILCREELESLAAQHKERFRLHLSLTGKPLPDNWAQSVGRITRGMLECHLPTPGADKLVCICGPSPMEHSVKDKEKLNLVFKAPRGLSAEEKRTKLLEIFHESRDFYQASWPSIASRTAHEWGKKLKELEKLGPKLKGIVSQSVKDVLQSLVDDGLVQGDKIGSSNFFWSFPSQKGANVRARLCKAQDAALNTRNQLEDMQASIAGEKNVRKETVERAQALQKYAELREESARLVKELDSYGDADPAKYEESKRAVVLAKEAALRWTGNNYSILLTYFCRERGIDPEEIRRHFGVPEDYEDIY
ncbi:hypothetical protein NP233_g9237 [Leucocoprinus birnbaumii]|uniref:Nitrate reductase [NADPH] n=1 Tax=Leucocoprinus birnbaumii TaxID=56174 RepID=A0AAD5VKX6_9AGAR|nr:hypothetical protein NP233_g9237 [Leucocoprinus birnbaumii]